MSRFFPIVNDQAVPSMVFVDGENLAVRYGRLLQSKGMSAPQHVAFESDVYVWSTGLNNICFWGGVRRCHYYTSIIGDTDKITDVVDKLKAAGIQAPNVFKRTKKKGSKTHGHFACDRHVDPCGAQKL